MAKLPESLHSIRGMSDLLPVESRRWQTLERTLADLSHRYGFAWIRTPIVEPTGLFVRSIGEVTDIVEKEMYRWNDRLNGQDLCLRPENTASCVRAYFEHGLSRSGVQRWFYLGPMFRHERPQKGRYRQFHQFGLEILGSASIHADLELILFTAQLWKTLGINPPRLEINTLGIASERTLHRSALIRHWEAHSACLDDEAKNRLYKNPLRVLDSKNPQMQPIIDKAPQLLDFLGEDSRTLFAQLQAGLTQSGIDFRINPRLVRGLDYYNHSVFEWVSDDLGAQGTVCGGGRYDGLAPLIADAPLPACGFAIGLERLLSLMPETPQPSATPMVWVAFEGAENALYAQAVAQSLREQTQSSVLYHFEGGKFAHQIKKALELSCSFVVLIGERERNEQSVTLKILAENRQQTLPRDQLIAWFRSLTETPSSLS